MRRSLWLVVVLLFLVSNACYRATVDLEKKPSTVTIKKAWATGWIFGLVPPKIVTTAQKCPNGAAKVQTKLGFWNQVVGALTLGIYTPMNIQVTCAEASAALGTVSPPDIVVREGASEEEIIQAFQAAADEAVRLGRPVIVQF